MVLNNIGPFKDLDAEQVEEEVGNMWRTMHKLSRTLADNPSPKRSAEITKGKLDKFKAHLPLLQTFCNPGIRDRHWKLVRELLTHSLTHSLTNSLPPQMSDIVGFNLKPSPTTPLSTMIEYGLDKHLEKYIIIQCYHSNVLVL